MVTENGDQPQADPQPGNPVEDNARGDKGSYQQAVLVCRGGERLVHDDPKVPCIVYENGRILDLHESGLTKKWYVIDAVHPGRVAWDVFMGLLIAYQIAIVPVEIGFVRPSVSLSEPGNSWWWIELVMGMAFTIDIVLNCLTCFVTPDGVHHWSVQNIVKHYFCTFPFHGCWDVVAQVPFVIQIVEALVSVGEDDAAGASGPFNLARASRITRILRIGRYLRLVRLLRIERMSDIVKKLLQLFIFSGRYSMAMAGILQVMGAFIMLMHLSACLFAWVSSDFQTQLTDEAGPFVDIDGDEISVGQQYIFAFYWCVMTLSGGSPPTNPTTETDMCFWTVISFIFVLISNISVGILCGIFDKFMETDRDLSDHLQIAMRYITTHKLSPFLKGRILSAVRCAHQQMLEEGSFVDDVEPLLSEDLKGKIKGAIFGKMLAQFPPFQGFPSSVLGQLALEATTSSFVANDHIFREGEDGTTMVVVTSGKASITSKSRKLLLPLVSKGWWLDAPAIFSDAEDRERPYSCIALTDVTTIEITRDAFAEAKDLLSDGELQILQGGHEGGMWCPICSRNHDVLSCHTLVADHPMEAEHGRHHHVVETPLKTVEANAKLEGERWRLSGSQSQTPSPPASSPKLLAQQPSPSSSSSAHSPGVVPLDSTDALTSIVNALQSLQQQVQSLDSRCTTGLADLDRKVAQLHRSVETSAR